MRSFALTGLISILYFLLFWRMYRDPSEDESLSETERAAIVSGAQETEWKQESAGEDRSLGSLLGQRKVIGLAIGFGSYNYVFYLLLTWLPSYLSLALHIELYRSFLYTSLPWLVATICDLVVGGWLVDALIRRGF